MPAFIPENAGSNPADALCLYGITQEQYEAKWSAQGGLCAICRGCFESLQVDHCHETGKVRGLLCKPCNTALGMMRDRIPALQSAIEYLRYHRDED